MWKQLNRFKNTLTEKTTVAEKKLAKIVPIDPRKTMKGKTNRDKKKAIIYEGMAKDYTDYAADVRSLDSTGVDTDVLLLSISEADLAQRISDTLEQLSNGLNAQSDHAEWEGDWKMSMFRDSVTRLRTAREIIRVGLNRKYDIQFPTLEQTAKSKDADEEESVAKGNAKEPSDHSDAAASKSDDVVASTNTENVSLRTWTDRTGRHQIQAKYLGLDGGKVKLKKADGTIIHIPIASLSEADQRFIGIVP
jgi:hypothetical protein